MVNRSSIPSIPLSTRKRKVTSTNSEFRRKLRRFEAFKEPEMSTPNVLDSHTEQAETLNLLEKEARKDNHKAAEDGDSEKGNEKNNEEVIQKNHS